jgi:hypothetical protein
MSSISGLLVAGSVSGAGDLNGDAHADLLTPQDALPLGITLRVHSGGRGGYMAQPALVIEPAGGDLGFPCQPVGAGDVNGDGLDDFVLSSNLSDGTAVRGDPTSSWGDRLSEAVRLQ